jgi:hypothetical protein
MAGYKVVGAFSIGGSDVFRSPVLIGSSLWVLKQSGAAGQQFYEIDTASMTGLSFGGGDGLSRSRMAYDGTNFWTSTAINRFYRNVVSGYLGTIGKQCWFGGSSSLFGIDPATNTVTVTVASVEAKEIISDATYLYCLEPTQNRMTKIGRLGGHFYGWG